MTGFRGLFSPLLSILNDREDRAVLRARGVCSAGVVLLHSALVCFRFLIPDGDLGDPHGPANIVTQAKVIKPESHLPEAVAFRLRMAHSGPPGLATARVPSWLVC